jgi:endonuclease YncB( thermonuclease family)
MKTVMLLCSLISAVPAAPLEGKVVGVKSGNEIEILSQGSVIGIRIQGIECPGKHSVAGKAARRYAADLAFLSDIKAVITGAESAGAFIGIITLPDGKSLGAELIRKGLARCDKRGLETGLAKLESQARRECLGLWASASNDDDDGESGKEVLVRSGPEDAVIDALLTR